MMASSATGKRLGIGPEDLDTFLAIAELRSFSKAAARLSLTQPSISNRVQRLERAVRTRLFERTTRAVTLTPAGEALHGRVEPIMRGLRLVIDDLRTEAETRHRLVTVAATPMLATVLLPPIISRFCSANPTFRVELEDRVTDHLASDIRSGRLDFAVIARQAPMEGITFEPVVADPFMVVGPRGHPALRGVVQVRSLAAHPFLLLGAHRPEFEQLAAVAEHQGVQIKVVRTVTNVSTLLGLVAEGFGLSMLPSVVLRLGSMIDDTRFATSAMDGVALTRDYGIASLAGHDWQPAASAFARQLRAELLAHSSGAAPSGPG